MNLSYWLRVTRYIINAFYAFFRLPLLTLWTRGVHFWPEFNKKSKGRTYVIDARAWLGDLVSGTKYMSLCNVLFLVKYKVHVFSVFRFLKAQKYKHMIFMLNLVFEVQKYKVFRQFLGKIKNFWGKIKNRIFYMIFSTEHDVRIKMWWRLAVKNFAAIFSRTKTILSFDE